MEKFVELTKKVYDFFERARNSHTRHPPRKKSYFMMFANIYNAYVSLPIFAPQKVCFCKSVLNVPSRARNVPVFAQNGQYFVENIIKSIQNMGLCISTPLNTITPWFRLEIIGLYPIVYLFLIFSFSILIN